MKELSMFLDTPYGGIDHLFILKSLDTEESLDY